MPILRSDITGLVLAGGRGSRMGGVDKGLVLLNGQPLARHALERLRPQVGQLAYNANRNLETYAAMGVPVWPDADGDFAGPLAGWLAGLAQLGTDWLATVPCDTPNFPTDLVARLGAAIALAGVERTRVAMATTVEDGGQRRQPVFALLHRSLADDLRASLAAGERKVDRWTARHGGIEVPFDDPGAFFNANTESELAQLQQR